MIFACFQLGKSLIQWSTILLLLASLIKNFILCVWEFFAYMHAYVPHMCLVPAGAEVGIGYPELGLQMIVTCHLMLRTEVKSFPRATSIFFYPPLPSSTPQNRKKPSMGVNKAWYINLKMGQAPLCCI